MKPPILYSFRRCPYAMRARLAIASAGVRTELREIVLREKAPAFLEASPKGTVPVIVHGDRVIEESLEIMNWALSHSDPEGWLESPNLDLIAEADGPFKEALDRTKYAARFEDADPEAEREKAGAWLIGLAAHLRSAPHLGGARPNLTDFAILPFVRQFANIDRPRFDADHPGLTRWLDAFLGSERFSRIMTKYPKWTAGDEVTHFP